MLTRKRSANGRFEQLAKGGSGDDRDPPVTFQIPRSWAYKLAGLLLIFLLASPWVFIFMKRNSFSTMTQKITDFYDDNFSCSALTRANTILDNDKESKSAF